MATRIDRVNGATGPHKLYPWDQWMDGSAWRIVRGEDFACKATNMRATINTQAWRSGMKIRTRVDGDAVEFQFYADETFARTL